MGSTGSTWLAKLLNSHPDVLRSHEALIAQLSPASSFDDNDTLRFIEYFAWDNKTQRLRGSRRCWFSSPGSLAWLPAPPFTRAPLLRHPARILNTRLSVYPHDQSFSTIPNATRICVQEIWGIEMDEYAPIDQIFIHDAFIYAAQASILDKADCVIHIENMSDPDYCRQALKSLTGLLYDDTLIESAIRKPANRRTAGSLEILRIVEAFTPRQRAWYDLMFSDVIPYFGYEIDRNGVAKKQEWLHVPPGRLTFCQA